MKKRHLIISAIVLAILTLHWYINDIQRLQGNELLMQSTSPEGGYTLSVYLNTGSATTDSGILVQCRNNTSGHTRNIYWKYHDYDIQMQWLDDHTALVNGQQLDVRNDTYRDINRK